VRAIGGDPNSIRTTAQLCVGVDPVAKPECDDNKSLAVAGLRSVTYHRKL
jgi:hypothetical protein